MDRDHLSAALADLDAAILDAPIDSAERRDLQDRRDSCARELRAATIELARASRALPPAVTTRAQAIEAETALALASAPIADPARADTASAAVAMTRATRDLETRGDARRERERYAYQLYCDQRTPGEIVTAVAERYAVAESTARDDLARVRGIAESWRSGTEYAARRDQHVMGLRALYDLALSRDEIEVARKVMADVAAIEGYRAPSKGIVMHGHVHTTLPTGPGYVAGVDVRELSRAARDAILLLLPDACADAGVVIEADSGDYAITDE